MPTILVPYHLDVHLPDLETLLPRRPDVTLTADFPEGDIWERLAALFEPVAEAVAGAHSGPHVGSPPSGQAVTVVSGDCSTSLGTVAGLQRAGLDPAVVWFDAHGDVQAPETSTSSYPGGMPLRFLVGHRPDLISSRLGARPVAEARVVLVGARDLDPAEQEFLASAAIRRLEVGDLCSSRDDVGRRLPPGPLLLHLDVDVVDGAEVAGLRYPTPGGPSAAQVLRAIEHVRATGRVVALEVACTWHSGVDDPRGTRSALLGALLDR